MAYVKVGDVAAQLGVSEQAVRLWCRTGVLPALRPTGTRQWLIDPDDLDDWLRRTPVREVLDSLNAQYREDRPDHEVAHASVSTRRRDASEPARP